MSKAYIAVLEKTPNSDFGVWFPDFPGCVTAGKTLEEARHFAAEALEFHLAGMVEDGEDVPEPSSLDAIVAEHGDLGGVPFLVDVKDAGNRVVRINVTIPGDVLGRIDRYAAREGLSRSALLAKAVEDYVTRRSA